MVVKVNVSVDQSQWRYAVAMQRLRQAEICATYIEVYTYSNIFCLTAARPKGSLAVRELL